MLIALLRELYIELHIVQLPVCNKRRGEKSILNQLLST